ncbi:hypothetical protein NKJ46_29385 [Mesorhizobium sp. M0166]|uniref:hypothetical protein n=1 Tax=Mesorhizobium sp. M0166 TaxID=2956902 RepID=UPI0033353DB5
MPKRSASELRSLRWHLASDAYWRREEEDIVIATKGTILRLNSASARMLEALVGIPKAGRLLKSGTFQDNEVESLLRLLVSENIVVPGEDRKASRLQEVTCIDAQITPGS